MKHDYFRVQSLQELSNPQQQEVSVATDAGLVNGDDSMIYIVKENRSTKVKSCQILREIVKESGPNYYQHLYEDNVGKPLLIVPSSQTVYFKSNRKGLVEKVQLGGKKKDVQVNWINANIEQMLGMFRLDVKPEDGQRSNRTYDLVVGADAKSDTVMVIADAENTSVQPSRSLHVLLQQYDTVVQVEEMAKNMLALLVYSSLADVHALICVRLNGMKFETVDTYKFKKGQKVETFTIADVVADRQSEQISCRIVASYGGSKLIEFAFGAGCTRAGRGIRKLHHTLNFRYKVADVIPLDNILNDSKGKNYGKGKFLVRADQNDLHVFAPVPKANLNQSCTSNLLDTTGIDNSIFRRVFKLNNQVLVVSQDSTAKISISAIRPITTEEILADQLKAGNLMTALNIVYSTGRGQKQLIEYQLRQKRFGDLKLLESFLKVSKPGHVKTVEILEKEDIESPVAIQRLLEHAKQSLNEDSNVAREQSNAFQIYLHTRQQRLIAYKQAFSEEAASLEHQQVTTVSAQDFIIKEDFLKIVNTLLYNKLTQQNDQLVLRLIFEEMFLEAIENYTSIIKVLPLEDLNPASLLPFLPPGRSATLQRKPYWAKARSLVGDQVFKDIFVEDSGRIFETLSVEYCYDLYLPGKALVILKEALQNRGIQSVSGKGGNLTWVALEAIERALHSQKLNQGEEDIEQLPEDRRERCEILFQGCVSGVFDYFRETKWVFALSRVLYDRYLVELKAFIQSEPDISKQVKMILEMAEGHKDPDLIALKDQDVVQIALDTIYLKMKVTDDFSRIKFATELLEKSENQQAFIDKHLQKHYKFAEIAIGQAHGQNLMKNIDRDITFRDLLRLQLTPSNPQNVAEIDQLCRQMMTSQLVGRVRVRDQVYNMGMRTGTKIFDKGKNIGKQTVMTGLKLISKSAVGGAVEDDDAGANEQEQAAPQTEFKWVQLYQSLNSLLACIGYDRTINVERHGHGEDQTAAVFSLDQIVLEEVLKSKDPQVIRHLLQHAEDNPQTPHISTEALYVSIISHIKKFYAQSDESSAAKTASSSQFFEFYTGAMAMLDLLHSYSTTDPITVMNETRLLEVVSYMTQHNILIDFPLAQIRADFYAQKIIERALQMHGLEQYPADFDTLVEIQGILGQPKHHVAIAVLDHFERTHYLDELEENDVAFVTEMIVNHLIRDQQTQFSTKLAKQLLKVLKQDNSPVLLSYLISNIDKSSEEFTQICKLKYLQDATGGTQDLEQLERALGQDLPKKALYYYKKKAIQDLGFSDLCLKLNFPSKEAVKRLCKVAGQSESLERVTDLIEGEKSQGSDEHRLSIQNLIQYAIIDPSQYDTIKQEWEAAAEAKKNQVQESDQDAKDDHNAINRLVASEDDEVIKSILVIDFTDDDTGEIDFTRLDYDLNEADVPWLGAQCSKLLLQNYRELLGLTKEQATAIQALIELAQLEFSVLHINPSIKSTDLTSLIYAVPQFQCLRPTDELFLEELLRHISEHNIYQVSYILENHSNLLTSEDGANPSNQLPNNAIAPLLLYISKIELVLYQLLASEPNIPIIYNMLSKETLEGLLLQTDEDNWEAVYELIKKAVTQINNKAEMQVSHKIKEIRDQLKQYLIIF